jgi:hypothetical protein
MGATHARFFARVGKVKGVDLQKTAQAPSYVLCQRIELNGTIDATKNFVSRERLERRSQGVRQRLLIAIWSVAWGNEPQVSHKSSVAHAEE